MLNRTTPRIEGPTSDSVAISAFNIFTIICISAEQVSVRFFFCFKKKEKKKRTRHHEAAQVPKIPYTIFILIWSRFFYRPTTASIAARTHYFKRRDKWTSRSSGSDARQHFHQLTSANELKKKSAMMPCPLDINRPSSGGCYCAYTYSCAWSTHFKLEKILKTKFERTKAARAFTLRVHFPIHMDYVKKSL